jgi:phage terminase Nu1 subunit (DNA packaging protein)
MSEALYKVGVIAKLFGLSERRIQQMAKDGIIPKAEKGRYELIGCVRGYIKFLQDRAFGKDVMTIDAHQERARLLKAQADKTELEVQVLNQGLVPITEVEIEWASMVTAFRTKMLFLPIRATHLVIGKKEFSEVEQVLRDLVVEALSELSLYESKRSHNSGSENGKVGSTTTATEDQPVGGQLPPAEQ